MATLKETDLDPDNLLWLADSRASDSQLLWISGCSFSHAIGVTPSQRYGQLVADTLKLPASFLTCPGSSIQWASDQLLRSDIRANDIILWGITGINRFISYKNKIEINVLGELLDRKDYYLGELRRIEEKSCINDTYLRFEESFKLLSKTDVKILQYALVSDDRLLYAIKEIFQVINYCRQIGAKLILFRFDISSKEFDTVLLKYLSSLDNYIHLSPISDYGTDNEHPGPITHDIWANEILKFMKRKKYI